ncbi:Lipid A export ATP-binding/permease protein msbA [Vibrio nigripulchritudo SO65]|uniref:lipid A ABC transporter ATP-binding protein/permease MsbA n=1 Tax=Vibrio nigripulchritudo TaxID=28173 RepID=UPI0003B21891|nr:lipid A ABC transporter ATP-binding protein/permease MsbA [Vibrio nigripulchritudo]KJY80724.1 lipid transporter ATP-binding/permease [Vibrio nigripulchritudo]CCN35011.1 Lipid A export ATP-binding/permease protein msbA [Vibrio nigripulchritudo AM115]CCN39685.1 Lipid A export ATP-binding/permease protein msbA [Vibrio nigripulchritudo FTn2]CCN63311.1 Lipid A export ATP-binding/permease protein msbA [Vibrio nigripulchritudo POn4]CCN77931.1 Lipid A export ATP-binding/permease protein msbA [Vibri
MSQESDQSTFQTFKRLWPYISNYKIGLVIAAIALVVNALSDTYMISLLKPLLDEGFGSADSDFLKTMPIIILVLMLVRGGSGFLSAYFMSWVSNHVVMKLRREIFNHFMKMPVSFFDKESTGRLLSRITYDTEQVAGATSQALVNIVRETASLLGFIGLMVYTSWQLSLVVLVVGPVVAVAISTVSRRLRKISKNMQTEMGNLTTSSEQMLNGHKVVLSCGGQEVEEQRFNHVSNAMRQQNMKMVVVQQISSPVVQMIGSSALVTVLFLASMDSIRAELTAGAFTVVFSSLLSMLRPLRGLTAVMSDFQRGMAASQTLFSLLDMPTETDLGKVKKDAVKGDIEVSNVTFTYPTKETPALKNVSFSIPQGKTVALVGRSGSGKSTIASLFTRFYELDEGTISLDGVDVKDFELENLRQHFGLVSQHVHLFNDTVANNIAYAAEDQYTREQIVEAAKLAYAHDFIEKLDNGYDTVIGENGVNLSGGQRQRLAIARALLRNAPVLILDEATSALDTESERAIQSALDELQKDKTVLVIAHRLSTIENADEILVVDSGEVIERGDHESLIELGGSYAQLYSIQFDESH